MLAYADGAPMEMEALLRKVPVRLTSVEDYARAVM